MSKIEILINAIKNDDDQSFNQSVDNISAIEDEFKRLSTDLGVTEKRVTELTREISKSKANNGNPEEKINSLHKRIKDLQADLDNYKDKDIKFPVINSDFPYKGNKLIVIKEMKPSIYMNSFLEYIGNSNIILIRQNIKRVLVLVIDSLTDDNRLIKYRKHNFPINEAPTQSGIVITNKSLDDMKSFINFDSYDIIFVIDRSMRRQCAVSNLKEDVYYMIDSPSDIVDFNLDKNKCIGFFKAKNLTPYIINPDFDITRYSDEQRAGQIAECEFITRVLEYEV